MLSESSKMELVKKATRDLKKQFKGMSAHSYGYCCNSDYDAHHHDTNYDDYVDAKLYKGGLNNTYTRYGWYVGNSVAYAWNLTEFSMEDVIKVLENVYGDNAKVVRPKDHGTCIMVEFNEAR